MSTVEQPEGLPMTKEAFLSLIASPQPYRYEWRDERVYAMPGGTGPHSAIAEKLGSMIRAVIGWRGPCDIYRDRYVEIPGKAPLLPDLVVSCTLSDWTRSKEQGTNRATIRYPRFIVEVLSEGSTGAYDRKEKRLLYQRCPTLDLYMLCSQDQAEVTLYRRSTLWQPEHYRDLQVVHLPEFQLDISLDELYSDILYRTAMAEQEESQDNSQAEVDE